MKNLLSLLFLSVLFSCGSPAESTDPIDQHLVYLSSRGDGFDIYTSHQDGSQERQLTTQKGWDWGPRWWPAKQGILHYSQDTANNFSHQLITVTGESIPVDFQELTDFIASPDGNYALFTKNVGEYDHLFMQDLSKRTASDLTPFEAYHGRQAWSPDSQSIALLSDRSGSTELYIYKLADQSLEKLTEGVGRVKYISWSPEGNQIAFTREVLEEPKRDHDIYLINIETREVSQLTNTDWGEQEISWSPMGDKIAYHGTIDGKDDIYTIDLETKEVVKITGSQGYHGEPTWIPIYK